MFGPTIVLLGSIASLISCQVTSACWIEEGSKRSPVNCINCGSGALIKSVEFSGCSISNDDRCRIILGKNHTIKITFVPYQDYEDLYINVWGRMVLLPVYFPMNPSRVCGSYNVSCPLKKNQEVTFELELFFDASWPRLRGTATFELYSPRSSYNEYTKLVCGQIRFQLASAYSWRGHITGQEQPEDDDKQNYILDEQQYNTTVPTIYQINLNSSDVAIQNGEIITI